MERLPNGYTIVERLGRLHVCRGADEVIALVVGRFSNAGDWYDTRPPRLAVPIGWMGSETGVA